MARARRIRPEFFKDADIADCSVRARLLLIGLWTLANGSGVLAYDPFHISDEIFPSENDVYAVEDDLSELINAGLIRVGRQSGRVEITINRWNYWQRKDDDQRRFESITPYEWRKRRQIVFERDRYQCAYCGQTVDRPQCDHIVPLTRGGSNDLSNLATSCADCNMAKGSLLVEEWRQ